MVLIHNFYKNEEVRLAEVVQINNQPFYLSPDENGDTTLDAMIMDG